MKLEELTTTPLKEEEDYLAFRSVTYDRPNAEYMLMISSLMKRAGKKLINIRKEILYGEQNGTLDTAEGKDLQFNLDKLDLNDCIEKYFKGWYVHDSFAYETAKCMGSNIFDTLERINILSKFISNDQLMRVYVSRNLPVVLNELNNQIKQVTGKYFTPSLDSFEFYLLGESEKSHILGVTDFAQRFTYYDTEYAEEEVKRLFNPSAGHIYQKIRLKKQQDKAKCEEELETLFQKGVDYTTLHRFVRLSHWAAFEEPKKRYSIEGGIVDYLFRELTFQHVRNDSEMFSGINFCLQLKQDLFLDALRRLSNVYCP